MATEKTNEKISTKVMVVIFIGVAFLTGFIVARARYKPDINELNKMVHQRDEKISTLNNLRDRIIFKEGELIRAKDAEVSVVEESVLLEDGTEITPEGVVIKPNGEEEELSSGDSVFMDGAVFRSEELKEMQEQ